MIQQLRGQAHQSSASCLTRPELKGIIKPDGLPIYTRRRVTCRDTNEFRKAFQSPEPGRSNDAISAQQPLPPVQPGTIHGNPAEAAYGALGDQSSAYVQQRMASEPAARDIGAEIEDVVDGLIWERSRWPHLSKDVNGKWTFYPGFLLRLVDPLPPEFIVGTVPQQLMQVVVLLAYAGACALAFQQAWAMNYNFGLVLALNWARDKLSPLRLGTLCTLAWFSSIWIYWVFFIAARVDEVMQRIAQPLSMVCRVMVGLWVAYVCFSPIWHHPTPFFSFAPGVNPFSGPNVMRV